MSLTVKTGVFATKSHTEKLHVFDIQEIDTTGVTVSDKAILSPFGLDPICNKVSVLEEDFDTAGEMTLKLTLAFEGEWDGMDSFVEQINATKGTYINLQKEPHPYKPQTSNLFMVGKADEIMALGEILRDSFVSKKLEIDTAEYPVVHPELIGEALDKISEIIAKNENRVSPQTSFSYGAYHHDWS